MTALLTQPTPTPALAHSPARASLPTWPGNLPPVILLGGGANALSVARQLGRLGAPVHALAEPGVFVVHSRYCRTIDAGSNGAAWERFLLGPDSDDFRGAVLLSCCDEGIELIARRREELAERYLLDESNPRAQLTMLNKLATYRAAKEAGVPTPGFWVAESPAARSDPARAFVPAHRQAAAVPRVRAKDREEAADREGPGPDC